MSLSCCPSSLPKKSCESTIWICSASNSGNEQYTHSLIPLAQNINQSHRCIWYRRAKSVAVLPIGYDKSYLLVSSAGLDTSPLVFFWLVVVLSNCVQWYFQKDAWCRPSSWDIFITRCQTLQLYRCGSGFQGYFKHLIKCLTCYTITPDHQGPSNACTSHGRLIWPCGS